MVAIFDLHVVVSPVDSFDEDDKLLYICINNILKSIFDNHSIMNDVYDETLTFNIRQFSSNRFEYVRHCLAGLIIQPFRGK